MTAAKLLAELSGALGDGAVLAGDDPRAADLCRDEALGLAPSTASAVVFPASTAEVATIVGIADRLQVPLTARGAGTGLSGACTPQPGGVVVAFDRMDRIIEIDTVNHVAVVQPGVTLEQLDEATAAHGLVYPVFPGEQSASLGGNVATNAGGMRAVKYGVTRHQVIGVEAVLGTGEVMRFGGKYVKSAAGYDLTQLVIGSEGTLALVTEATLRLYPRAGEEATLLAPFDDLAACTGSVPHVVGTGVGPLMVEYIDSLTMAAIGVDLGVDAGVQQRTAAYLVVVLEGDDTERLSEDTARVAGLLTELGALDVYVLPPTAGTRLIEAREKAFWVAKAAGADEILDVVVPRSEIAGFMEEVGSLAQATGSLVAGCGHAGDGNVHLSVFQPDPAALHQIVSAVLAAGVARGGAVSGEHGIGLGKKDYLSALEDPAKIALWRRIKAAFDPAGILNPGKIFDVDTETS